MSLEMPAPPRRPRPLLDGRTILLLAWTTALVGGASGLLFLAGAPTGGRSGAAGLDWREVANRLRGAGVKEQAAVALGRHLDQAAPRGEELARLAFAVAQLYLDAGRYEEALTYLYLADEAGPPADLRPEVAARIVASLEQLKKHGAARYALQAHTSLDRAEAVKRGGEVVARVGADEFTRADIDEALGALPPQLAEQLRGPEQRLQFARSYVAEELLRRRAVRLELDKDPQLRTQLERITRQLLVERLLERELAAKGQVDESDLRNFFTAHQERYAQAAAAGAGSTAGQGGKAGKDGKGAGGPPSFEQVKERVARDYLAERVKQVYGQLLDDVLRVEQVQFFPEALRDAGPGAGGASRR